MAKPALVVLGGLPGTGKSDLSREIASRLGAALLRIDEIEAAMWRSGVEREQPTGIAAYEVAQSVAERTLRSGTPVVADAVNAVEEARAGWREVAEKVSAPLCVIEVICSDFAEHRRRVEARESDIDGQTVPTWDDVVQRDYEPWTEPRLVIDTCRGHEHAATIERYVRARAAAA